MSIAVGKMVAIQCSHCNKKNFKPKGAVTRARNINAPLYCNRTCAGLARRVGKTKAQKVEEKRIYDAAYRDANLESITAKKAAYYQRTRDPAKEAVIRKKRMSAHVAYCQRPEYVAWKANYDRRYRAREYGPFAESFMLLHDIDREVNSRMSDYEVRSLNMTRNKRQQRRRDYENLVSS